MQGEEILVVILGRIEIGAVLDVGGNGRAEHMTAVQLRNICMRDVLLFL